MEHDVVPGVHIELIAFSDEEGRFGGMFGSQSLCGQINPAVDRNHERPEWRAS